jgi:hypothetical protein
MQPPTFTSNRMVLQLGDRLTTIIPYEPKIAKDLIPKPFSES